MARHKTKFKPDPLIAFSPETPVFVAVQVQPHPAVLAVGRDYEELREEVFELLGVIAEDDGIKPEEYGIIIQKAPYWPGRVVKGLPA